MNWFFHQGKDVPNKLSSSTVPSAVHGEIKNKVLCYVSCLLMSWLNKHFCKNTALWPYNFTVNSMKLTKLKRKNALSNSGMRRFYFNPTLIQVVYKMKSFIRL